MPRQSAGLLIYKWVGDQVQVMLVHPGGPFWAKKDLHAWSLPKGEFSEEEDPLQAAIRETREETGFSPAGKFHKLTPVKNKSGKWIHAWMVEGEFDIASFESNSFEMEWPPRSGKKASFPEVDDVQYFNISTALEKINQSQAPVILEFSKIVGTKLHSPDCEL